MPKYSTRKAQRTSLPKVTQNLPHGAGIGDASDDPHLCLANRADQRGRFVDTCQQHCPRIVGAARQGGAPAEVTSTSSGTNTGSGTKAEAGSHHFSLIQWVTGAIYVTTL